MDRGLTAKLRDSNGNERTKYGSTISDGVCQELGFMSSEVAYVSIEPDYTSYRTVELYKSQNCSGQAFVAGIESGVSEVSIDTDDFGGPIWDDQARSVKISDGL